MLRRSIPWISIAKAYRVCNGYFGNTDIFSGCAALHGKPCWELGLPLRDAVCYNKKKTTSAAHLQGFPTEGDDTMNPISKKIFLTLTPPTDTDIRADRERILEALAMPDTRFSLAALRDLQPMVTEANYQVTVTLCPGAQGHDIIRVEPGDTRGTLLGIAYDIGSTTLKMELLDLVSGKSLAEAACKNSQSVLGADILSRIFAVKEDRSKLETLRELVIRDTETLISRCCASAGADRQDIGAMVIGGNTTMIHFFLGCDPWHVFQSPYTPVFYDPGILSAAELGLGLRCSCIFLPAVANYLGGDITGGLLLTELLDSESPQLFFDIGTNGELAMGCRDFLLVGAGAAGPALEGAVSISGMLAEPGAVNSISISDDGTLHYTVLGGGAPKGICGSGILDLIAEASLSGWISGSGAINEDASPYIRRVWSEEKQKSIPAIFYTGDFDSTLFFTEDDVTEYISCKAAAFTMVATMLDAAGLSISDISRLYLSGGFGTHFNMESAIAVGMYPDIDREKFVLLGNSSLGGAKCLLLHAEKAKALRSICEKAVYIQFGEMDRFLENMIAAQFLPHTNLSAFPSVEKERLRRRAAAAAK